MPTFTTWIIAGASAAAMLLAAAPKAEACSRALPSPTGQLLPPNEATVSATPLLYTNTTPSLTDDDGNTFAVVVANDAPTLAHNSERFIAFRPAEPLATGVYTWVFDVSFGTAQTATFFVDDALVATPPPDVLGGALSLLVDEDGAGCSTGAAWDCGDPDVTRMVVDLDLDDAVDIAGVWLEVTADGAEPVTWLTKPAALDARTARVAERVDIARVVTIDQEVDGIDSLKRGPVCVRATPVTQSGVAGTTLDLGCIDANDSDDARLGDTDGSGCVVGRDARGGLRLGLWFVLLLGSWAWLRRRDSLRA